MDVLVNRYRDFMKGAGEQILAEWLKLFFVLFLFLFLPQKETGLGW